MLSRVGPGVFFFFFFPSENRLLNVELQGIKFKGDDLPCIFLLGRHLVGQHGISPFARHGKLLVLL